MTTCDKDCGAVWHLTGGRHRIDCAMHAHQQREDNFEADVMLALRSLGAAMPPDSPNVRDALVWMLTDRDLLVAIRAVVERAAVTLSDDSEPYRRCVQFAALAFAINRVGSSEPVSGTSSKPPDEHG